MTHPTHELGILALGTQRQGNKTFRAFCVCGWRGGARTSKDLAERDRADHLAEITVPVVDRCRDARQHQVPVWRRCALCAGQLDLFDELAARPGGDLL